MNRVKKIASSFIALFVSFQLYANKVEPNPMNVLFIGNSYTHQNSMPTLFEKIAISKKIKINVEMSAKSGHTFKMHTERPELFEKIKTKKWDYVIIQGFSRELMHDYTHIDTASIPYFNKIVDSIYANNPCTTILLYMTWGYKNGFAELEYTDTYQKMTERVANGYKYLSNIYEIPMVPVGEAWRSVRENNPAINLYQSDDQHPTLSGSYLAACSFYSAIFKAEPINAFSSSLDLKEAEFLQRAAFKMVNSNLETYRLKNNTIDVSYERIKADNYIANCKANFPFATSITWDFGDGNTSIEKTVVHKYKKAGTYYIKLIVNDSCGTREIYRKVHFNEPKNPQKRKASGPSTKLDKTKKI